MPAERRPAAQDSEPRHPRDLIYTDIRSGQIASGIIDPELKAFAAKAAHQAVKHFTKTDLCKRNMARAMDTLLTFGSERQLPYSNRQAILHQLQALAQGRAPDPRVDIKKAEPNPRPPSFTELEIGLLENAGGIITSTEKMVAVLTAIYEANCKDADFFSFKIKVGPQKTEEVSLTASNLVDYAIRMALNQGAIDVFASGRPVRTGNTDPTCRGHR